MLSTGTRLSASPSATSEIATTDNAKACSHIRKWGCLFDGKDPISFLERVEELHRAYGFTDRQLLMGLPELLRGNPLLWYRNCRDSWNNWTEFSRDFRARFLPPGFERQLRRAIQGRCQKPHEQFNIYATEILTMMRRAGGYTPQDKIDKLYEGMEPEYRLYINRNDISSVSELTSRANEYEEITRQQQERQRGTKSTASPVMLVKLRQRQDAHSQLPPDVGKRLQDRRRRSDQVHISFNPRPHISIQIHRHHLWALIDSGSEVSFVSTETAQDLTEGTCRPAPAATEINLANGSQVPIEETFDLPITFQGETFSHRFSVLPNLSSSVLIGTDLWAKLGFTLPPPPLRHETPVSLPPVLVTLGDGQTVAVPHYAAHISRRYRTTTLTGRWVIRFDRHGRPRMSRRLNEAIGTTVPS